MLREGVLPEPETDLFVPVRAIEGAPGSDLLLLCDHAANFIPQHYDDLGLSEADLRKHIAYDIGAEALTVNLAERLGAWAVLCYSSRLLIDPNRGEDDPTLIVPVADGIDVPGNAGVGADERRHRMEQYYLPYHDAIDALIEARIAAGHRPVIVSMHSFTPVWQGEQRPWHVGVLWDRDPELAQECMARLAEDPAIMVGDNEPYSGKAPTNSTLNRHAVSRGLPHVLLEVRQDLIADDSGVAIWTDRLTPILGGLTGKRQ